MRRVATWVVACLLVAGCSAMFADEAGLFDWARVNVGAVSHAAFVNKGKAVVVGTASGVLASLSTKTGDVSWRKVLSEGKRGPVPFVVPWL